MQTLEETVLKPIMWAVAALMVGFHKALSFIGMPADSGWTWAFSIIGLTIVIRIILIPLFVKQIHASRRMQLIQPEMQKIQKKYKGKSDPDSRKAMSQETMDLYKRTGTNPFSSCLPILLQSPIFFALFRVLNDLHSIAQGTHAPIGPMSKALASSAESSTLIGASLSSTFLGSPDNINVRILTAVLIILMSATTFTTQHQLMRKNMPAAALDNPAANMQKYMLYLLPVFFAVTGINFPVGVLLYWLATNVWSMGQQFYVIRRMPAPGSPAERALEERRVKQGKVHTRLSLPGLHKEDEEEVAPEPVGPVSGQRVQPKRKDRQKAVGGAGATGRAADSSAGEQVSGSDSSTDGDGATRASGAKTPKRPTPVKSPGAKKPTPTTTSSSAKNNSSSSGAKSSSPNTSGATSTPPGQGGKKKRKKKGAPSAGRPR
jgi:YidC/Oxa1 family membrane protein insertase